MGQERALYHGSVERNAVDPNEYGDYQGVASDSNSKFHFSWTDSRVPEALNEDLFGAP